MINPKNPEIFLMFAYLLIFSYSSFNDFFTGYYPNSIMCFQQRKTDHFDSILFIHSCNFLFFYAQLSGAALCLSDLTLSSLIEDSLFMSCMAGSSGGAISFNCPNSHFIFSKVCASNCTLATNSAGQFCQVSVGESKRLETYFLAVEHCWKSLGTVYVHSPVYCSYGTQKHNNMNFSRNNYDHFGIWIYRPNGLTTSYSTLANNFARSNLCYGLYYGTGTKVSMYVNVISNSNSNTVWGIIHSAGHNYAFSRCIISQNSHILFSVENEGSFVVDNSYIDHSMSSLGSCIHSTSGNQYTATASYSISDFSLLMCEAKNQNPTIVRKERFQKILLFSWLNYLNK